jgi:HSP20 family molecular chaperone IbpA
MTEEGWEDFGFRFGPFEVGFSGLGQFIKRTRTETSHVLRIRIDPAVKKEEIKARLVRPGLLEIELPRHKGEDIPIE